MKLNIPSLLIINGIQGSGKSNLIKYLMSKNKDEFCYGLVFTNTSFDTSDQSSFDYISKRFVHSEYNEDILEGLMNIQAGLIKQGIIKESFVIFDDCLDADVFNSRCFKRLSTQLRHYHITVILSTQYPHCIPPRTRSNCMSTVIFYTDTEVALKALHSSYGQKYSFQEFRSYVMNSTGNYNFIYYNKKEKDNTKQYQVMKAPTTIKPFKVVFNTNYS